MKTKRLESLLALLVMPCLLFVVACGGSDDSTENNGGEEQSSKTIMLEPEISELTTTRGTAVNSHWKADGTEKVSVKIGSVVKEYYVNTQRKMDGADPFSWNDEGLKDHSSKNVVAWYPYSTSLPGAKSVNSDQSADNGLDGSDFLYGTTQINYHAGDWLYPITFYHQLAKIVVNVNKKDADDSRTISNVQISNVYLSGNFTAPSSGNLGTWSTTGSTGTITAHTGTWEALVIPQTVAANTAFITFTIGGETYTYTTSDDFTMNAGKRYNCTFTVNKNDLRLKVTVTPWTTGATESLPF